ncbi:hypothetical protein SASPL_115486 [Salvia splendens]|uniref:Uncharacterized protein n=1 Tax=Salvia splendens TaxID=180675 RepID=A0A8X8Y6M6_SALSN|nr:hypothetical protein SASPL_115486 [Salvia splendens]
MEGRSSSGGVPEGHLPVYVGDEMELFVVSAEPDVNISLPIFRLAFPDFTDSFMNSVDLQPKLISDVDGGGDGRHRGSGWKGWRFERCV